MLLCATWIHKHLIGLLPQLLLSAISMGLSDSLEIFFSILYPECWHFSYPALPYVSVTVPALGPSGGRTERE